MQSRVYSLRATEPPSNPKRRQALKEEMWKTEASDTIVCQACYDAGTASALITLPYDASTSDGNLPAATGCCHTIPPPLLRVPRSAYT